MRTPTGPRALRRALLLLAAAGALGAPAGRLHAQRDVQAEAALARLDPATRAAVLAVADSARAAGLPTAPLHAKAAEGASKGAAGARIVAAVRELAAGMRQVRDALGAGAAEAELVAGAGAVAVGVPPDGVRRLRGALGERATTQSLVVLTDLVRRGVPRDDAVDAVLRLARAGTTDAELLRLRAEVASDVGGGMAPRAAMETRLRQYTGARPPARDPLRPAPPPDDALPLVQAHAEMGWRRWAHAGARDAGPVVGGDVAVGWPLLRLRAHGALPTASERRDRLEGELLAAVRVPVPAALHDAGLRAELQAGAARTAYDSTGARAQRGAAARLAVERPWGGAWASAGRAQSWRPDATPTMTETGLGAWRELGGVTLTASVRHRAGTRVDVFTTSPLDSLGAGAPNPECATAPGSAVASRTTCRSRLATTDVDVGAQWLARGVELRAAAGARLSSRTPDAVTLPGLLPRTTTPSRERERAWASGSAVVPVSATLSVVAAAAREPSDAIRGLPARHTLSLGVRLAPAVPLGARARRGAAGTADAPVERVVVGEPTADGRRPLRLVLPGARQVELRGDMTGWEPVTLASRDGRLWEHAGALAPGVYHFTIRVNGGEWRVPAGAATADDGFGGAVAVLVVADGGR